MIFLLHKLVYCLTWKTHKCNSLVQKICMFLQKRHHIAKTAWCWALKGPRSIFLATNFNARKPRFHVFPLFHVRKHMTSSLYLKKTDFTRNCKFCSNCGSPATQTKLEQIHNFLQIWSDTSGEIIISYVS